MFDRYKIDAVDDSTVVNAAGSGRNIFYCRNQSVKGVSAHVNHV